MNRYEGIFIFRPDLKEEEFEKECSKVEEMLKKHEAKIEKSEKWGKKALTFKIKKCKEGFFFYMAFEAPPQSIKTFTEAFKIDGNILRAQITRKEERKAVKDG